MRIILNGSILGKKYVAIDATLSNDNLETSCDLQLSALDDIGNVIHSTSMTIDGEQYQSWTGSNEDIKNIITNKIQNNG